MNYIIDGYYANGDKYGDKTSDIAQLAWILSDINRFDTITTDSDKRVLGDTITITTEKDE